MTRARRPNFALYPTASAGAFTLVEVVIAVALMGVTLTGAFSAIAYAARDRRFTQEMRQGNALAAALAREIDAQRFADPHGSAVVPTGPSRAAFNNIADYHAYSESPPTNRDGSSIPGCTGWRRAVAVERAAVDNATLAPSVTAAPTSNLIKFTVTAVSPSGKPYSVALYRSAFGLPDQATPNTGLATTLTVRLQCGTQTSSVSVDLLNQPAP